MKARIRKCVLIPCLVLVTHTKILAQEYPFVLDSTLSELENVMKQNADSSLELIILKLNQAKKADWFEAEVNLRIFYLNALHMLNANEVFFDSVRSHKKQYDVLKTVATKEEQQFVDYLLGGTLMEEGKTYLRQGKYDSSILVSNEAKRILGQLPVINNRVKNNLATINNSIAGSYFRLGRQADAEKLYEENLIIFEELGHAYNMAVTHFNLGTMASNRGLLSKALDHYLKMLDLSQKNGLSILGFAFLGVSQVYQDLDEFEKGLKNAREALVLAEDANDQYQIFNTLPEIAASHRGLDQPDSALHYFKRYLQVSEELGYIFEIANAHDEIGRILLTQKKYEDALTSIRKGLSLVDEPDYILSRLYLLNTHSTCLLEMGRIQEALESVEQLLDASSKIESNLNRKNAFAIAQRVYKANNMYRKAFEALEQYSIYKDSTYNEEKSVELARVEYDFRLKNETEKMELEKEKQDAIYQQELKRERLIRYGAFGTTGFIVIILIILYQSFQQKKRNNRELSHRNEIIELKNGELTKKNTEITELRSKEKQMADDALAMKERELTTITMLSHEKNTILQQLGDHIGSISKKVDDRIIPDLEEIKKIIKANLNEESWSEFMMQFEKVHPQFFSMLKTDHPSLTQHDLRLCSYLRVGMDNKEIAQISAVSVDSVKKSIYRLKKKMELDPEQDLRSFFLNT